MLFARSLVRTAYTGYLKRAAIHTVANGLRSHGLMVRCSFPFGVDFETMDVHSPGVTFLIKDDVSIRTSLIENGEIDQIAHILLDQRASIVYVPMRHAQVVYEDNSNDLTLNVSVAFDIVDGWRHATLEEKSNKRSRSK